LARSKLYRSFIILQEDERGQVGSDGKSLSGYAKVEAKGDKCKISFYAQNLRTENKYSMVLICCKKEFKELINLGDLAINDTGKGDTSREYYINNIADMGISYEKISGAAICKSNANKTEYVMYGFMNGEEPSENWREFKTTKVEKNKKQDLSIKKSDKVIECKNNKKNKECKTQKDTIKEPVIKQTNIKEADIKESVIKENTVKEALVEETSTKEKIERSILSEDERNKCKKVEHKKDEVEEGINKICNKLNYFDNTIDINIPNLDCDYLIYGFIKKKGDKKCKWEKFKIDKCSPKSCFKGNKRLEENTRLDLDLDKVDFDKYEREIYNTRNDVQKDNSDKTIKCFEEIAQEFEQYSGGLIDIDNCKWRKINVDSMDDLCDESNYNKYTLAYYPMINYYPYISKRNHFLLGYKYNNYNKLQYIVYGIPGSKDKEEQPYGGKTGFVTWTSSNKTNQGYWLMFYDFKNSSIVIPMNK